MNPSIFCNSGSGLPIYKLLFVTVLLLAPVYAAAATHTVRVLDPRSFSPNNLTIEVGDTVRWVNDPGGNSHDVTADDFSFNSPTASGFEFEMTFNSVAEILYHCSVHSRPASEGGTAQNGRINVVAAMTADVGIDSVDVADGSHKAGENLDVKATLTNSGSGDSGIFNVDFYASTDANITSSDTLLDSIEITNITAGGNHNIDEAINLPSSLDAGDYFIGAISDLDDTNPGNDINVDNESIYVFITFIMNAGLNDAWFNPITDGQGFFITVFADLGFVSLAWFTYDTELPPLDAMANLGDPGHRWFTAGGLIDGDQSVMDIEFTSGGLFDTPSDIERTDPVGSDGTLTLTFTDCHNGTIEYDITTIGEVGTVPIRRVAFDNVAFCETLLRESQQIQ